MGRLNRKEADFVNDKNKRVLNNAGKKLIEKLLSEGKEIELIPVKVAVDPLKADINPGIRITMLSQTDAETGEPQKQVTVMPRWIGAADKRHIEAVLSAQHRVRLLPDESGVRVTELRMKTLRWPGPAHSAGRTRVAETVGRED